MSLCMTTPALASDSSWTDGWTFDASIYMWMPSLAADLNTGGDIYMSFSDLLSNLNMTYMIAGQAEKGRWGIHADLIYMSLGGDKSGTVPVSVGPVELPVDVKADVGMKSWINTVAATYNVLETDNTTLKLLGGVRYLKIDTRLRVDVGVFDQTKSRKLRGTGHAWDGIVGLKGETKINDRWYIPYYADVGAGGSDLTWQALAGVGYKFNWGDAYLTYRYMNYDLPSDELITDLTIKGPLAGVTFSF